MALALTAMATAGRVLSEVILADTGDVAPAGTPVAGGGSQYGGGYGGGGYSYRPTMMDRETYTRVSYEASGANSGTIWILMITTALGYMCLFALMSAACFWPRTQVSGVAFQRFPEPDPEVAVHIKSAAVSELEPMWRKAFIGKVYTILVLQILVTLLISVGMMFYGGYDFYVWSLTDGAWTRLVSFLATFIILISMMCYKNAYPLNLGLLFVFTCCMSYTIGIVCVGYAAAGMQMLVVEAFAITSLIFIALTIFTMQSGYDFSFLGAILPILLFTLIIWGFFAMFAFPSFAFSQVYALLGTLIFSLYVLYDTHAITTYMSYDDYVLGAISLYLDFINLFLMILQLLTGQRQE